MKKVKTEMMNWEFIKVIESKKQSIIHTNNPSLVPFYIKNSSKGFISLKIFALSPLRLTSRGS